LPRGQKGLPSLTISSARVDTKDSICQHFSLRATSDHESTGSWILFLSFISRDISIYFS